MTVRTWLKLWIRQRRRRRAAKASSSAPLREFVYLDETSVYSLVASRIGAIAAEFTETQTLSLRSEVAAELQGNAAISKAKLGGKLEGTDMQGSQILRKVTVQSTFKELREYEDQQLVLHPPAEDEQPYIRADFNPIRLKELTDEKWCVSAEQLQRGKLIELEVELQADDIFRASTLLTTFSELLIENQDFLPVEIFENFEEAMATNRIIERFLVGLVPLRCRVIDYQAIDLGGDSYIVHRRLLDRLPFEVQEKSQPLYVVGVTEKDLFWKDLRRVLFSQSRFTVLCRLSQAGIQTTWTPVKLVDVVREIGPDLASQMNTLGPRALNIMSASRRSSPKDSALSRNKQALADFGAYLAQHHGATFEGELASELVDELDESFTSITRMRESFDKVAQHIDGQIGSKSSRDLIVKIRRIALIKNGLDPTGEIIPSMAEIGSSVGENKDEAEALLDTEIIAIYW